jgi:formate dehydrogenase iron-sulfur subunit
MSALRCQVSCDSAARAVGADALAAALQALGIAPRRTSSRGLFWLEPLLEVETPEGLMGFGPLGADELPGVLAALRDGTSHPKALGAVAALPFLARQQRLSFARAGRSEPLSLTDYEAQGGWVGLRAAQAMAPADIVAAVLASGLRGRGGAAFAAGVKWRTVLDAPGDGEKFLVCNADEGDSGSYADRMLMEGDPYQLIEGMAIAAHALGAREGFIYVRSEYPDAVAVLREAIRRAPLDGLRLEVRVGAGSYVCGEETALLESIEGRPGWVRAKPPIPALSGLWGRPTLVHNVLSFAALPHILALGAESYRQLGVGRSSGTLPFQLAGNVKQGGLVEVPFGLSLRELVFGFGGGSASGRPVKAIQVGGPLGAYVPEAQWDLPLDIDAYAAAGLVLGHGGVVVHDDRADMAQLAQYAMQFCAVESCGKCTPCRIGSRRGVELIERIRAGDRQPLPLLRELCNTMAQASLCAMGSMTPLPVLSALEHYPQDFGP